MTALELAALIDRDCRGYETDIAAMLRKQDAAIDTLRDALEMIDDTCMGGSRVEMLCRNALAATEEFK